MKKQIALCVMMAIIILTLIVVVFDKPSLSTATSEELLAVYGVGEHRLEQIQEFILDNPNATVEDLRIIKGVDDMIIDQLKERFR